MHPTVYRVVTVLCALVAGVPVGTNLGLVVLLWMLLSGRLLTTRGAVIPVGILVRVGSAHGQRLGVPLALVRAPAGEPSPRAHDRALVRTAMAVLTPADVLVVDRAFGVALLQEEQVPAWAARLPKHF